jgi:hypothetical protein
MSVCSYMFFNSHDDSTDKVLILRARAISDAEVKNIPKLCWES